MRRDLRKNAFLAAPAFALALAACGADASDVSSDTVAPPAAAVETTDAPTADTSTTSAAATSDAQDAPAEPDAPAETAAPPSRPAIQLLSADEAIANAEVNQPNLQTSDNILDIETLAVGDGSVQTLRQVVDGDRPVLLWFFSPH